MRIRDLPNGSYFRFATPFAPYAAAAVFEWRGGTAYLVSAHNGPPVLRVLLERQPGLDTAVIPLTWKWEGSPQRSALAYSGDQRPPQCQ